jgi:hypothetical protein
MTPYPVGRDAQVSGPSMHVARPACVGTASDGGAKFFDHQEGVVGRTRGTDDDGERAVGTAVRRTQRPIPSCRPGVLTPSMVQWPAVGPG